jgi:hypothetical protein
LGALAASGPESWSENGKTFQIDSTYYLSMGTEVQYTIEQSVDPKLLQGLNQEKADAMALPLMLYAYSHRLHERVRFQKLLGSGSGAVTRIGVAFTHREGARKDSFRTTRTLDQLARAIQTGGAADASARP